MVTFTGQGSESLQASGVVVVVRKDSEGSGSMVCMLVQCCTLIWALKKQKTNKSSREKYFFNAFCALQILGRILPSADKRKKLKWQQTIPPNETCHQRVTCRKLNAESDMEGYH